MRSTSTTNSGNTAAGQGSSSNVKWSVLEDTRLMQAVTVHGDKWNYISTTLKGKSQRDCALRYTYLSSIAQSKPAVTQASQAGTPSTTSITQSQTPSTSASHNHQFNRTFTPSHHHHTPSSTTTTITRGASAAAVNTTHSPSTPSHIPMQPSTSTANNSTSTCQAIKQKRPVGRPSLNSKPTTPPVSTHFAINPSPILTISDPSPLSSSVTTIHSSTAPEKPPPKKRGRKKGSKNAPKVPPVTAQTPSTATMPLLPLSTTQQAQLQPQLYQQLQLQSINTDSNATLLLNSLVGQDSIDLDALHAQLIEHPDNIRSSLQQPHKSPPKLSMIFDELHHTTSAESSHNDLEDLYGNHDDLFASPAKQASTSIFKNFSPLKGSPLKRCLATAAEVSAFSPLKKDAVLQEESEDDSDAAENDEEEDDEDAEDEEEEDEDDDEFDLLLEEEDPITNPSRYREVDQLFEEYQSTASESDLAALLQAPPTVPVWVNSPEGCFSEDQVRMLKIQMQQHFQLVSQAFILTRELHGSSSLEAKHWVSVLEGLKDDREKAVESFGEKSVYIVLEPPAIFQKLLTIPGPEPSKPRSAKSRAFIRAFGYQLTPREKRDHVSGSAHPFHTSQQLTLKNAVTMLTTTSKKWGRFDPCPWFEGLEVLVEMFPRWDPYLLPCIFRVRRNLSPEFLPQEDALLVRGLVAFGPADLQSIRAFCLPTKSVNLIHLRIKSLTARGRAENPVKQICLRPFRSLTILEKDLLREGVKTWGEAFKQKSLEMFAEIPSWLIGRAWGSMFMLGEVSCPWPSDEVPEVEKLVHETEKVGSLKKRKCGEGDGEVVQSRKKRKSVAPVLQDNPPMVMVTRSHQQLKKGAGEVGGSEKLSVKEGGSLLRRISVATKAAAKVQPKSPTSKLKQPTRGVGRGLRKKHQSGSVAPKTPTKNSANSSKRASPLCLAKPSNPSDNFLALPSSSAKLAESPFKEEKRKSPNTKRRTIARFDFSDLLSEADPPLDDFDEHAHETGGEFSIFTPIKGQTPSANFVGTSQTSTAAPAEKKEETGGGDGADPWRLEDLDDDVLQQHLLSKNFLHRRGDLPVFEASMADPLDDLLSQLDNDDTDFNETSGLRGDGFLGSELGFAGEDLDFGFGHLAAGVQTRSQVKAKSPMKMGAAGLHQQHQQQQSGPCLLDSLLSESDFFDAGTQGGGGVDNLLLLAEPKAEEPVKRKRGRPPGGGGAKKASAAAKPATKKNLNLAPAMASPALGTVGFMAPVVIEEPKPRKRGRPRKDASKPMPEILQTPSAQQLQQQQQMQGGLYYPIPGLPPQQATESSFRPLLTPSTQQMHLPSTTASSFHSVTSSTTRPLGPRVSPMKRKSTLHLPPHPASSSSSSSTISMPAPVIGISDYPQHQQHRRLAPTPSTTITSVGAGGKPSRRGGYISGYSVYSNTPPPLMPRPPQISVPLGSSPLPPSSDLPGIGQTPSQQQTRLKQGTVSTHKAPGTLKNVQSSGGGFRHIASELHRENHAHQAPAPPPAHQHYLRNDSHHLHQPMPAAK
ncbi:hypothetical protein HDV05_006239, partial [Chytridiales sp. JEL 0842]